MVAGANQQQFLLFRQDRGQCDRRSAIALHRLEDDARVAADERAKFLLLRPVGDDDWGAKRIAEPLQRQLEKASISQQRQQMLGPFGRRQRP